jgi:hypothetical protein
MQLLKYSSSESQTQMVYLASGASAELMTNILFVPAEVIKCRLQLGTNPSRATGGVVSRTVNYRGAIDAATTIAREEVRVPFVVRGGRGVTVLVQGVRRLWAGWKASLLQDCMSSAIQFFAYENLKRAVRHIQDRDANTTESFVCGGLAGGLAAGLTNPFDMITARLMSQNWKQAQYGNSMFKVLMTAYKEGSLSLWRGTIPRVFHAVPAAAVQFAVFEWVRRLLESNGWGTGGGSTDGGSTGGADASPEPPTHEASPSMVQLAVRSWTDRPVLPAGLDSVSCGFFDSTLRN